jgi:hypothetical protein
VTVPLIAYVNSSARAAPGWERKAPAKAMAAHAAAEKVRCIKLSIMGGLELSIMDGLESASDISGGAAARRQSARTALADGDDLRHFNRRRFTLDGGIARQSAFPPLDFPQYRVLQLSQVRVG